MRIAIMRMSKTMLFLEEMSYMRAMSRVQAAIAMIKRTAMLQLPLPLEITYRGRAMGMLFRSPGPPSFPSLARHLGQHRQVRCSSAVLLLAHPFLFLAPALAPSPANNFLYLLQYPTSASPSIAHPLTSISSPSSPPNASSAHLPCPFSLFSHKSCLGSPVHFSRHAQIHFAHPDEANSCPLCLFAALLQYSSGRWMYRGGWRACTAKWTR